MIVLVGFMGAGKTTVGMLLADKLGLPLVDTDAAIERSEGRPVAEIFETDGEARFRTLERDAVASALEGPESVVSVGGGAMGDPTSRAALEWHTVIYLDVSYPEAMRRVGHDPGRPMLNFTDPKALFDAREPIYKRLATHVIDTDGIPPDHVVARIIQVAELQTSSGPAAVHVRLGSRSYPVFVGGDISRDVVGILKLAPHERVFVITHQHLMASSKPLIDSFVTTGAVVATLVVDEGEASKSLEVAGSLLGEIATARANRSDLVVGFGGGVVCDLAGFVASTYHRGMPVLQAPTTLLAQVDAAVGGKTAVNLPAGKNLVGTIHQPVAVVCDVSLLRSLPDVELRSGMAEVVKYGLIVDPSLLDLISSSVDLIMQRDEEILTTLVRRSVAIKADIVSADERETGRREVLNYGHTFGHAIEHATGMRHGEAIAIGMLAAARLAIVLGMLDEGALELHRRPLELLGLPTSRHFDVDATLDLLKQDKKHRDGSRFVLLEGVGSPRTGVRATDDQVRQALRSVTR